MKLETKLKKWSLSKFKRELWKVFAKYVKIRDNYRCYTCGVICKGKNAHCGHFIPASVCGLALYFHEDNNHLQCAKCNIWLQGNQYIYGQKLGEEKVKKLYKIRKDNKDLQYTKQDYVNKIEEYKRIIDLIFK